MSMPMHNSFLYLRSCPFEPTARIGVDAVPLPCRESGARTVQLRGRVKMVTAMTAPLT